VSGLDGPNGMTVDQAGNIYVASEQGKKVTRISRDGKSEDIITCDSPDGLDFDRDGNLVISNFYSGAILVYKNNKLDTLVQGLHHPADIKFDKRGNLYISQFDKNDVMVFTAEGKLELVVKDIVHPFGLAIGNGNDIFVTSNESGEIYKINNGKKMLFAKIPGTISYLVFSQKTELLYVASFTGHRIYKVNNKGEVSALAGRGVAGHKDGGLNEAQFDSPNSVALSRGGDLLVTEFKHNRLRRVEGVE
jgi:sugar lactone lactonase YvrE